MIQMTTRTQKPLRSAIISHRNNASVNQQNTGDTLLSPVEREADS